MLRLAIVMGDPEPILNSPLCISDDKSCLLHLAVSLGHAQTVAALLAKGALCNARNNLGQTAFHCAAENGSEEVNGLFICFYCFI